MMTFEDGAYRVTRWYEYKPTPFAPMKSDGEAREELLEIYKRAINRHLLSDVPVGLLLSGGLDSGLLLALMNLNGKGWPTYTVGYGASFADDELVDAAETAAMFGAKHSEIRIDHVTFERTLPKIVSCLEEPIASSSIVPMYFVCQRARQDVTVALTGQGPDELFGGYRRHLGVRYGAMWGGLPGWMREPIASAISALPRNETLKRGVYALGVSDRLRRYQHVLSILPGNEVDGLFQDGVLNPEAGDAILGSWNDLTPLMEGTDELGGLQYIELRSTLPDELLMYSDKLSMAHSLELRVPYLDKEVVEYAERLPARFKIRNSSRKWIHRQVCSSFLPRPLLTRKKRGFAVNVVDAWFQDARGNMEDIFRDPSSLMYEYLRPQAVQSLLAQHRSRQSDNHKMLFSLVVFEEWLRLQRGSPRRALAAC
jgi:asparagine synthase (glutamine-hydrolysing)